MFDCVVVGAGPSGCKTAEIVAKNGYEVLVLEEHSRIGEPVQCTGLVSKRIGKIPKKIILNKVKKARFFCKKEFFEVESKEAMFVLDRKEYDLWLAEKARRAGARIKTSTRFLDFDGEFVLTNIGKIQTKILVGADGPNSTVAKKFGIELPRKILFAKQVVLESSFDKEVVELHFGSKIAPGFFAWVVPENETKARVGLMCRENPNNYLKKFLRYRFEEFEVFGEVGDVVRLGLIKESVNDKVLLVGDAACQLKPFSAGGLVYDKICAEIAGEAVVKALEEGNFSKKFFIENYEKKWKEKLAFPIKQGMFLKSVFERISDLPFVFKLIRELKITSLARLMDVDFLFK